MHLVIVSKVGLLIEASWLGPSITVSKWTELYDKMLLDHACSIILFEVIDATVLKQNLCGRIRPCQHCGLYPVVKSAFSTPWFMIMGLEKCWDKKNIYNINTICYPDNQFLNFFLKILLEITVTEDNYKFMWSTKIM